MLYVTFFLSYQAFEIQCIFPTSGTSPFEPARFQVPHNVTVASVLDNTGLDASYAFTALYACMQQHMDNAVLSYTKTQGRKPLA